MSSSLVLSSRLFLFSSPGLFSSLLLSSSLFLFSIPGLFSSLLLSSSLFLFSILGLFSSLMLFSPQAFKINTLQEACSRPRACSGSLVLSSNLFLISIPGLFSPRAFKINTLQEACSSPRACLMLSSSLMHRVARSGRAGVGGAHRGGSTGCEIRSGSSPGALGCPFGFLCGAPIEPLLNPSPPKKTKMFK